MITIENIKSATATSELHNLMRDAASERNADLDEDAGYPEQAAYYREEARCGLHEEDDISAMRELAELLDVAEQRLQEIDS